MGSWAVAKAELIDTAREQGPQEITRNGKLVAVLVAAEQWNLARRPPVKGQRSMSEFFRNSPLAGSGLKIRRVSVKPRHIEF